MARDAYFVKAVTSLDSRVFVIDTPSVQRESSLLTTFYFPLWYSSSSLSHSSVELTDAQVYEH